MDGRDKHDHDSDDAKADRRRAGRKRLVIARAAKLLAGLLLALPFALALGGGLAAVVGKLMSVGPLEEVGVAALVLGGAGIALLFLTDLGQALMQLPAADAAMGPDSAVLAREKQSIEDATLDKRGRRSSGE